MIIVYVDVPYCLAHAAECIHVMCISSAFSYLLAG